MEGEALVTAPRFSLGSRKRILLVSLGMEKDREIFAHRPKAEGGHSFRACPHDDVVAVLHRKPQQFVPNGTTHLENH